MAERCPEACCEDCWLNDCQLYRESEAEAEAEWLESIGAEPNLPGQDECPGCDGGPCMWATHIYPQPLA